MNFFVTEADLMRRVRIQSSSTVSRVNEDSSTQLRTFSVDDSSGISQVRGIRLNILILCCNYYFDARALETRNSTHDTNGPFPLQAELKPIQTHYAKVTSVLCKSIFPHGRESRQGLNSNLPSSKTIHTNS